MNIDEYIQANYNGSDTWFEAECDKQQTRILKVLNHREYLNRIHKILSKPDITFKGKAYKTKKLVLNTLKSILRFHTAYLIGNPVNLKGTDNMVKEFAKVYRDGNYNDMDYSIVDHVIKFADAYEYVYKEQVSFSNKTMVKSKLINPEDGFPVYSETMDYVAFIEHWLINNISYYYVYYPDRVDYWTNEGGDLNLIDSKKNISDLPIHWHNRSNWDELFGESFLEDLIPIMDTLEDFLSKMDDSIYTNSLNPIISESGGEIEIQNENVSPDIAGAMYHLAPGGTLDIHSTMLDSATIKLYLDTLKQQLIEIGCMPSASFGQSNIANVSQEVIEVLYQNADNLAKENTVWIKKGLKQRFDIISKLIVSSGFKMGKDDYIEASLNYNKIINQKDLISNLKVLRDMGAISIRDIVELSPYTMDVEQTIKRLQEEEQQKSNNTDRNNDNVNNDNGNNINDLDDKENVDN